MNCKLIFVCLAVLLSMCTGSVYARTPYSQKLEVSKDSLFQLTIEYLQDNEYCIDCIDLPSGFIKAKKYIAKEKLLSTSVGKRIELSLFVKPIDDNKSTISLTIYTVTLDKNSAYHQEGICKDESLYQAIIEDVKTECKYTESDKDRKTTECRKCGVSH